MKTLVRYAMVGALLLLLQTGLFAQTIVEDLQKAVENYNAMREYIDGLNSKTITQSNVDDVKARMGKAVVLLDKVIREGNADQIKVGRYFRNNARYQYGFVLGMKGENNKAYDVMKEIERDVTAFTSGDFPLRYEFFGKNFIINWDNFAPTQAEFLTGFAEICYNLSKYDDAVRVNKKALVHPNLTDWLRYISVNKMLDINAKDKKLLSPDEQADYALKSILEYDKLSSDSKEVVKENNYPTVKRGTGILIKEATAGNSVNLASKCAEAAPVVNKYEPRSKDVLTLYELSYRGNYNGDAAFHRAAHDFALNVLGKNPEVGHYVGSAATDQLALMLGSTDCDGMKEVANMYGIWGKTDKRLDFEKRYSECQKMQEKEAARAAKAARRSNRNFNFYVGANILPLINTNPKRDYGGVVNFVFKKSALEFGYAKIRQNKENIFDLWIAEVDDADQDNISRWDGYKAHFQPKFFTENGKGYIGILLGYNEKSFDSLAVNVIHDLDGAWSNETFKPGIKQYVGILNIGGMNLLKGFGLDMSFGIGANYSTFDPGNPLDRRQYTIENPLLEHRKDHYWGFVMRIGFTVGLNFGPGNY